MRVIMLATGSCAHTAVHMRGDCAHLSQRWQPPMVELRPAPDLLPLEPKHSRAICDEIGERLPHHFARDATPVPPHLRKLLGRFADLEGGPSKQASQ